MKNESKGKVVFNINMNTDDEIDLDFEGGMKDAVVMFLTAMESSKDVEKMMKTTVKMYNEINK